MAEALSEAQISEALEMLDGWERDGDKIRKTVQLGSYGQGLAYASTVGMIADGFNHHPDLYIGYKKVTIELTTHDAGNKISQNDIVVAKAINAVSVRV